MKTEQLVKNIETGNLPEEDKRLLINLLKQNRFDEYLKLFFKLIGLGSVFWD